jgi:two-component system, OmpR family, alkaline phosphatase synthesis response regulator PhoP
MENNHYRILLVDDEPDVLEFLGYNLKKEGYQIFQSHNGKEAIETAISVQPHLIILDVMMPAMDGIEACHEIKKNPKLRNAIVVFLTARGEDYSQIAGFDAGADDYITKPIKPRLLVSRVKALLRRYNENEEESQMLKVGNLSIDKEKHQVLLDEKEIVLPKKEFELLLVLATKPNKVFTREEIFAKVWGNDVIVGDRTIDVHVRKIREKIGNNIIKTIKGVGYKFEL